MAISSTGRAGTMVLAVTTHHHDSTIPRSLTPMVGRERELDRLLELLDDPDIRLVTILGPGGVGKTRLAAELAAALVDEFEREVVFVPLATIREPDLVPVEICRVLGIPVPSGMAVPLVLSEALHDRDLLLVLDNVEQVIPAADALVEILSRCPGVRLVVTSRSALGVGGEYRLPLAPLPVTPAGNAETGSSDAVTLFVARARAIRPSLNLDDQTGAVIVDICRRVDGLPLAIELAAARLNVLSPQALLARLDKRLQVLGSGGRGVPDRLKTMRQAIAWSYDLLEESEQSLFRRLSVFAGGFPIAAAEAVSLEPDRGADTLDAIGVLVDHSLIIERLGPGDEPRYGMLETLREFGAEQLAVLGEEQDVRERHAAWCAALAESAKPHLAGSDQAAWMARLDVEWDNIRVACTWANESGQPELTLRILAPIRKYLTARGHTIVARALIEHALAGTTGDRTIVRGRGLLAAGVLAEDQRDLARARALLEEARDLAIQSGDDETLILGLIDLAHEAHDRGDYTAALDANTRAIEHATALGDQRLLASALGAMGNIHYYLGELELAERRFEASLNIARALGDRHMVAALLGNLGTVAHARGDTRRAIALHHQAIDAAEAVNDGVTVALGMSNLAENYRELGELERAAALIERAVSLLREYGLHGYADQGLHVHALIALAQGKRIEAVGLHRASLAGLAAAGDQRSIAELAVLLAEICLAFGEITSAIELLGAASVLYERLGVELSPAQVKDIARLGTQLRRKVRESDYDRLWQAGWRHDTAALVARMNEIDSTLTGKEPGQETAPPPLGNPIDTLSAREREVMRLLVEGHSSREIGDALYISPRTATTHINNIYNKLGVNTRAQAVALAVRAGFAG